MLKCDNVRYSFPRNYITFWKFLENLRKIGTVLSDIELIEVSVINRFSTIKIPGDGSDQKVVKGTFVGKIGPDIVIFCCEGLSQR